jgi:hypothetical protein
MTEGVFGNAHKWKDDLLPEEFIPDIIELVIKSWGGFKKPDRLESEVSISKRFKEIVRLNKNRDYDNLPFQVWRELPTDNADFDDGRVDILFLYLTPNEEIYFAFECKRLRIPYPPPAALRTNNSEYVGHQGMMCFITGKYSRSVKHAGMMGYVMDGNIQKAISSLADRIKKKGTPLRLLKNTGLEFSSFQIFLDNVRETKHILSKKHFTIHHVFLGV